MKNLTKVHTWCFASGLDGYVSNQSVEMLQVCDAVRVTSKQSSSTPGIKRNLSVQANTDYILSVKGYSNRVNAFIWVMNKHTSQRLIPCYYYLGCQPCWKSYKFNTGCATNIDFGVLFTSPKIGDFMVLSEFELVRCDNNNNVCHPTTTVANTHTTCAVPVKNTISTSSCN
tara:strand:+ start:33 stop:545 length:513 start_codon:yes stop_codon:yes gene_type:complete